MLRSFLMAGLLVTVQAAHAQMVVVGHPGSAALSAEQVSDLFLGKTQSALLLDLPDGSPLRADFYRKATGKEAPQVRALWARLAFTGKAQPPREMADVAAVKRAVAADPKTVGYIDKASVDASVKVLFSID